MSQQPESPQPFHLLHHHSSTYLVSRWKNNGGSTRQIMISPPDSIFPASFNFRLSTAHVETSGPFSMFEGKKRILCSVKGECRLKMQMKSNEETADRASAASTSSSTSSAASSSSSSSTIETHTLLPFHPFHFSGDIPIDCELSLNPQTNQLDDVIDVGLIYDEKMRVKERMIVCDGDGGGGSEERRKSGTTPSTAAASSSAASTSVSSPTSISQQFQLPLTHPRLTYLLVLLTGSAVLDLNAVSSSSSSVASSYTLLPFDCIQITPSYVMYDTSLLVTLRLTTLAPARAILFEVDESKS